MHATRHEVAITTAAGGTATDYTSEVVNGPIHTVRYVYGDMDTGADFTITVEKTGEAILTVTNAGTSSVTWAPRQATHATDATASLYAASGEPVEDYIVIADSRIKIVTAQGGNTLSGTFHFIVG